MVSEAASRARLRWDREGKWYLHIDWLPGWPLGFRFDDSEDLITLQENHTWLMQ